MTQDTDRDAELGEIPGSDGARLRYWRRAAGVQRKKMAKVLGCDDSLLSRIERDEVELGTKRARRAARYLGITTALLLGLHDPEEPEEEVRV